MFFFRKYYSCNCGGDTLTRSDSMETVLSFCSDFSDMVIDQSDSKSKNASKGSGTNKMKQPPASKASCLSASSPSLRMQQMDRIQLDKILSYYKV